MNKKEHIKIALEKYKKGVKFKSPAFENEIYESAGDIAGSGFKHSDVPFINMWVQSPKRGIPQSNVPVFLNGEWGKIIE